MSLYKVFKMSNLIDAWHMEGIAFIGSEPIVDLRIDKWCQLIDYDIWSV